LNDKKWVLESPKSKYLDKVKANIDPPNSALIEKSHISPDDLSVNSDENLLAYDDAKNSISVYLGELKRSGDVKNHPLAWIIALLIVSPGVIIGLRGISNGENLAYEFGFNSGMAATMISILFDFLVIGQLFLGPGSCSIFAKRKHLATAVFVAMGSSAVLMINHDVIVKLAQANDILAVLTCAGCLIPLIMILRRKRIQLPAGRARHTWAFLMSVSILMFASSSLVVTLQNTSSMEISNGLAWSSLLLVAGAIGWAWPKGRHLIEEVAEEIIEKAV